jgi:predicted AAA+ superfamily ATPase
VLRRNITDSLLEALADTPVVFLEGPRQSGKTTLVRWLAENVHSARYLTLDDDGVLSAAIEDPSGFLGGLDEAVVLDEVQRAPQLFPALKAQVDLDRTPGRFLLTGSANALLLPEVAEYLVGRMEILTLWPFSVGEFEGVAEGFVDAVFKQRLLRPRSMPEDDRGLLARLFEGGYPEVLTRSSARRRSAWFASYVTTILRRDVRELSRVEGLTALPRLLTLLAARSAQLLNYSEISRSLAIPQSTLKRYMALLETTMLVHAIPAWSGNLSRRLVKSPKLYLTDAGLMAHLLGLTSKRLEQEPTLTGPLLETFVVMEVRKQLGWARTRASLYHLRTHAGAEVDLVLEDESGRLVGVEVKASATVRGQDFKGLRSLALALPGRFHRGVVLYTGSEVIPFGRRLHAMPVQFLWRLGTRKQRTAGI